MKGQFVFAAALLLCAGCGPKEPAREFPPQLVDGWKLESSQEMAPAEAPETLRALGVKRAVRAVYAGEPRLDVDCLEMNSGTAAFEGFQKWRQGPGAIAFYHDRYFLVVKSSSASPDVVTRFARAMETALGKR